jgi:hypothetical protein
MALSDDQISLMAFNDDPGDWNNLAFRDCWVNGYKTGARAIESEVRKQDDALIRQLVEALEYHRAQTRPIHRTDEAITAGYARLGKAPRHHQIVDTTVN